MTDKSTGKDLLVINIGIIFGLLILVGIVGFGFILFSYNPPAFTTVEYDYQTEVVALSPDYIKSMDLVNFMEVFALLLIAVSIAFAGLLYYVKE